MEAGLVGGEPGAHLLHTAKGTHRDMPVGFAVPGTSPVFQLHEFLGRFAGKGLNRVLVTEPVATGDGVIGVLVKAVVRFGYTGCAALRGHSMATHGVDLGDDRDLEAGIGLSHRDGSAETCATAAHK